MKAKKLNENEIKELLHTLKVRFEKNMKYHPNLEWEAVEQKLLDNPKKLTSLFLMEQSQGEPDVVGYENDEYIFVDTSYESPAGRRNLCYDQKALDDRKANKPKDSAIAQAEAMGIKLLNEEEYFYLQSLDDFDYKTSSWILTEDKTRALGGALFGDKRYDRTFIYHNGAQSYYASRGFRGILKV